MKISNIPPMEYRRGELSATTFIRGGVINSPRPSSGTDSVMNDGASDATLGARILSPGAASAVSSASVSVIVRIFI